MSVVKGLITRDINIVSTIHSPSPFTFRLFDRLMILLRGRVVYFGSRGGSRSLARPPPGAADTPQ